MERRLPVGIADQRSADARGRLRGGSRAAPPCEARSETPSAEGRDPPRCPHFGVCGGCSLQHLASRAQIEHKLYALGLWIVGVDLALSLGMLAGLVSFVLYVGTPRIG